MADNTLIRHLQNLFGFARDRASGMHTDLPPSRQPEGTHINAWGVTSNTTDQKGGGLYGDNGQDLCSAVPEGHVIRGRHFLEERDWFIYFTSSGEGGGSSHIGYVDAQTCEYKEVLNDSQIEGCDLEFGLDEWIPIESKYIKNGTCQEVHLYWTNGDYYKTINFDNPFHNCPPPLKCEDVYLLRCHAGPVPIAYASEKGGRDLEGGVVQYVCQFEDRDGNDTNWFQIGHPIAIETENNVSGELSEQAVHIKLTNLSPHYDKVNIAVIKTVGGRPTAFVIADDLYYTTDGVEFIHRSQAQEKYEIDIEEILSKKNYWFRGNNMFQFDGQLFPHGLLGEANEDWQDIIDDIEVNYRIVGVPLQYAHLVSGLRADEVYAIGLAGNYCDGTRSRVFHKKGRVATGFDRDPISSGDDNCLNCEAERWKVQNTAERTELICDNPENIATVEEDINYDTGDPIYTATPSPCIQCENGTWRRRAGGGCDYATEEECREADELTEEDASGVPTEDTIKNAQDQQLRALECICKRLAPVFSTYFVSSLFSFMDTPLSSPMRGHVLSDPVSIVTAWCACEELARQGGADQPDDYEDPEEYTPCDCCDLCDNPDTDQDCDCCDDCTGRPSPSSP